MRYRKYWRRWNRRDRRAAQPPPEVLIAALLRGGRGVPVRTAVVAVAVAEADFIRIVVVAGGGDHRRVLGVVAIVLVLEKLDYVYV